MSRNVALVSLSILLAMAGCSKTSTMDMVGQLASNPLVTSLTGSALGLNATQAVAGAGLALGQVEEKLPDDDWDKVAAAVPGSSDLIKTAKSLGGVSGALGDVADMSGVLSKVGLTSDQMKAITPLVGDFTEKVAGPTVGGLVRSVFP
jgi:hypothetical protein